MTVAQALYRFWASFGIEAYRTNAVPVDAVYPYIVYDSREADFNQPVQLTATVYDRNTSWTRLETIKDAIAAKVGNNYHEDFDNGTLNIYKSDPFSQDAGNYADDAVKGLMISLIGDFIPN